MDLPKFIRFADPDIETGVVIMSFLDISLHQEYQTLDRKVASAVIAFAQKYEFTIELDRMELEIHHRVLDDEVCGHKYFFLAAALGKWQLCGMCISSLHTGRQGDDVDIERQRSLLRLALDTSRQEFSSYKQLYPFGAAFMFVLSQASYAAKRSHAIDLRLMSVLFIKSMRENGEYTRKALPRAHIRWCLINWRPAT